jgi:hypothetical protein
VDFQKTQSLLASGTKSTKKKGKTAAAATPSAGDEKVILGKDLTPKIEYPMKDHLLIDAQSLTRPTIPFPSHSPQIGSFVTDANRHSLQENLLFIWNILVIYQPMLNIPYISVYDFEKLLLPTHSTVPVPLKNVIITLLSVVIRKMKYTSKPLAAGGGGRPSMSAGDDLENDEKKKKNKFSWNIPDIPFLTSNGGSLDDYYQVLLQSGDSYLELLKVLSEKENLEVSEWKGYSRDYNNFFTLIQEILDEMDVQFDTGLFSFPLDAELHELPNYFDHVSQPMDLGTIRNRLKNGYYQQEIMNLEGKNGLSDEKNESEYQSQSQMEKNSNYELSESLSIPNSSLSSFKIGQLVDVYNKKFCRWVDGLIMDRCDGNDGSITTTSEEGKNNNNGFYIIRYVGLGLKAHEMISFQDERILPHKAASTDKVNFSFSSFFSFSFYCFTIFFCLDSKAHGSRRIV